MARSKKLDGNLLISLGYGALTPSQANRLLTAIYDTGEAIVGSRLAALMSPRQLDEFAELIATNNEAGALEWLGNHVPNYREIVAEVFSSLESELRQVVARGAADAETGE